MAVSYDLVVIGGGIHGVGVAQAAAVKGYRVALIEKNSLAYGTSSRSSKLIHGGLRYLESAQFHLVRECLNERQVLLNIAPHLVKLQRFYIPVYDDTTRHALTLHLGLMLYGVFTGARKSARYRKIPRQQWSKLDGLRTENLQHVFQYWDAQTDDRLLTQAVMRSAQQYDAELMEGCELLSGTKMDEGWSLHLEQQGIAKEIKAKVIVNAAGPWVNLVLERLAFPHTPEAVDLVQGTHIILDHRVECGIYYVEAPADKRAVFVMPWYDKMMVGTTETVFTGSPDSVEPLVSERRYLLDTLAHYFPQYENITVSDISSEFAGLRVLPKGDDAFSRPRETIFRCDNEKKPSLLSIYGGKLTAYRATATNVLERLAGVLPEARLQGDTSTIMLPE
ncbi:MAG: glycerol-3-phosphate dehydrogenase/oxidase [Gammaproteobacteria bacterium]|nr:glycerol-3-phosphate dehydrogenase/oxidase [Gammaproteobacteria bacterium]